MNDVIKNGCFHNQHFMPWFSNDYPDTPLLPHYMGPCFSVLLDSGNLIQQNVTVRKDAWFTVRWEFTARQVSGEDARLQIGLYASSDHPSHVTPLSDAGWQLYAHTDDQPIRSQDGYLGIVFSNPVHMPDPGLRAVIQLTAIKLRVDYLPD